MWLTATEVFLGTSIVFLEPIQIKTNSGQPVSMRHLMRNNVEFVAAKQFVSNSDRLTYFLFPSKSTIFDRTLESNPLHQTITLDRDLSYPNDYTYHLDDDSTLFRAGVASWGSTTQLGSIEVDGKFDSQANFIEGKTIWKNNTAIGSVDLLVNIDSQIKPVKSITSWQTDTALGSLTVKGNFNDRIIFTGGNTAWNAKTSVGSLAIN